MTVEQREVRDFNRILFRAFGELDIQQGADESLEIEADEDLLAKVRTEVVDGVLQISISGDWFERLGKLLEQGLESQRIRYRLQVKELVGLDVSGAARVEVGELKSGELAVKLSGAGEIKCEKIEVVRLKVDLPGAGSIRMAGLAGEQDVQISGAGAYQARDLESRNAMIHMSGLGNATISVDDKLDATVSGLGRIEYYGDPEVTKTIQGLGTITGKGAA